MIRNVEGCKFAWQRSRCACRLKSKQFKGFCSTAVQLEMPIPSPGENFRTRFWREHPLAHPLAHPHAILGAVKPTLGPGEASVNPPDAQPRVFETAQHLWIITYTYLLYHRTFFWKKGSRPTAGFGCEPWNLSDRYVLLIPGPSKLARIYEKGAIGFAGFDNCLALHLTE